MFCPRCKNELEENEEGHFLCPDCGFTFYRNPRPATSVVIKEKGRVLLARRGIEPKKGKWDLVGGFLEYDEAPQECALRETKEETDLEVEVENFLGFYMDRYLDATNEIERSVLTTGFQVQRNKKKKPTPKDDVSELKWFDLEDLPDELAFKNTSYFLNKVVESEN